LPSSSSRPRFRLLALDIDGTLLDGQGILRPRTVQAIARAARAGIRPVLCTGRRYRRARPVAESLGLDTPLVCNSGALLKDPADHGTLWRADLDADLLAELFLLFRDHDEPTVSFSDLDPRRHDFVVSSPTTGRPLFDEYVELNRSHAHVDPDWADRGDPHFHLCAIGDRAKMLAFETAVLDRFAGRVQTFVQKSPNYSGTMCEVLRHDASKWTAVLVLAARWGIHPSEICAVGDDMNDLPMISRAGLGVAMAHAPSVIRDAAGHVTPGNDDDGVAVLIEEVLLA
jgi:Cof subfamily protein (haloacid dehalogenase superfamily)